MSPLNLLVLRCHDLERSRTFYEVFGLTFVRHAHGSGPEHYAHEGPAGVFELYPVTDATPGGDHTGLGFAVHDLSAAHASLLARGFAPGEARDNPWGRTFVARDPDGRRVEVKAV
jgi:catechol 2,3-dioxygenase-like lactoylglutathione lyase family enzyme